MLGGGTPSTAEKAYWSGSIPFFAPADIEKSIFCFSTEKNLTEEGLNNCSSKLYPKNTTLIYSVHSLRELSFFFLNNIG